MDPSVDSSIIDSFLAAGIVAKLVLFTLLFGSITSWAIIFNKWVSFRKVDSENRRFLILFSKADDLEDISPKALKRNSGSLAVILDAVLPKVDTLFFRGRVSERSTQEAGTNTMRISVVERTLQGAVQDEITYQERYLHLLATIGNTAPFVGLFGTVWGIMDLFRK